MFVLNDDNSIYATRGDIVFFSVSAKDGDVPYHFQPGEVLRIKIFDKKGTENVHLQKDFPVMENAEQVEIFLSEADTRIGELINKPKDYWYEVELNPMTNPQTIIGYNDEDGPAIFKLFPEGEDINEYAPSPEDFPVVDTELDIASPRPVANSAVAGAIEVIRRDSKKDYVTPQMFGAVGDGVADDTYAIQRAIDRAMETGETVNIPAGEYVITQSLQISTLDNKDWQRVKNVRISGAARSRTIFKAKMVGDPVFLFENVNNGDFSNAICEHFTITPYDSTYAHQFAGIVLINAVGNIYRDITIDRASDGLYLTTNKDIAISAKNTGYTEQNVFENMSISAVKGIVFNVGNNDNQRASYHGNIFENVCITANSNNAGGKAVAISLESGYIYNCTFNIKTFQSGADSHLLYINCASGTNTGTISYEDFSGDGVKISTGDRARATFTLDGNIYGLGNINWAEYHTARVGELDDSGTPITEDSPLIGRNKLMCRNLVIPTDLSMVSVDGKSYLPMPLYGGKEDIWSDETHNLMRYRNKDGNTEHGYLMACREHPYGRSRFILGTVPDDFGGIPEFVPGFYFFAKGDKIESPATGNTIDFREDGVAINGSLVRRAIEEEANLAYDGYFKQANGFTTIWGAVQVPEGSANTRIDLSGYGLTNAYNCQVSPFANATIGQNNTAGWFGLNPRGFTISSNFVSSALVYWFVIGYIDPTKED